MTELTAAQRKLIRERLRRYLRTIVTLIGTTDEASQDYIELIEEEDNTLKALSYL